MYSAEGADDCPIHEGLLQVLLHLQNTCSASRQQQQPINRKCTCSLHRILIKVNYLLFLYVKIFMSCIIVILIDKKTKKKYIKCPLLKPYL